MMKMIQTAARETRTHYKRMAQRIWNYFINNGRKKTICPAAGNMRKMRVRKNIIYAGSSER